MSVIILQIELKNKKTAVKHVEIIDILNIRNKIELVVF